MNQFAKARISLVLLLAATPGLALAAESSKQELQDAMRTRPNYDRGAELFQQCMSCHGPDAGGEATGEVPRIAGQHYRVLLKQLVDYRHGKRWDFRMEELADRHHLKDAQDIADVALFIASQERGGTRGIGSGEFTGQGQALYADRCQSCHGVAAEGNDPKIIPRLAGQHYGYLMRQMYDAVDGRRPSMLRSHPPRMAPLDFQEVRGLADYLSRLDPHPDRRRVEPVMDTKP
jgi:cytochrome c553